MKRFISIIAIVTIAGGLVSAQFTGLGTFASPYSGGTLTTDMTWAAAASPIYVRGDITIGTAGLAGHLTIEPGVTVKFLSAGSDIFITGLGRLTADGAPASKITFTADHDNDGTYGEAGETWGHISFQSMGAAGSSVIDNCILEYGLSTGTGIAGYGGALHIAFNNVTVSNTTFRHNRANWGGAMFVNQNFSPYISNCYVYNNRSNRGGGGFYFWNYSGSVIENCIFDSNHVLEPSVPYYTGGGVAAQSNTSVKILNCTFVNNTSTRPEGKALLLHSSPNARVINSVFWGSDKQVYGYGTTGAVLINCGYQGTVTYTTGLPPVNPIVLSASNTAVDGPNFVATDGTNWSITFASPLRDAGTNTSAGVTIPFYDYVGNERVYIKDIGAYEYQYSRWKADAGSTDWSTAANWEGGVPTASKEIFIGAGATNYPTGSVAPDVTIGAGKFMLMEPGSRATVGNLTNNGKLQLRANATELSSLILTSYTRGAGGSEEIDLYLSGGGNIDDDNFKWHYISSPVSSLSTGIFTANTFDLAQFIESRPVLSLRQGWVAFDGYIYSTGAMTGPTFNNIATATNGKGYNYWHSSDQLYTLSGLLNTSSVTAPLGFSGNATLHGYNLLGNPFISGLDWNFIINDLGFPANTSKGLYYTRDNVVCTYINGVGVPGDVTGIVPPMQGFFTKTYATANSIVLSTAARTHNTIHPRYKGSAPTIPLVRLALAGTDLTDETVVRFDNEAKPGWDNDFDAAKWFYSETKTHIYSTVDSIKYVINGIPFPEALVEIPIVIHTVTDGNQTLTASQIDGMDYYKVKLRDQHVNVLIDLKKNPVYTFSATAGTISDRFVLVIADLATGTESVESYDSEFTIYTSAGFINVIPANAAWEGQRADVNIIDLSGLTISSLANVELRSGTAVQVVAPKQNGVYFVEVRSGMKRFTGKVFVK